ncbi:hypothetical protein L21_1284 [Methanoculleus chikugoensis]|uniref:Uncharacterized protein n=1 Tax=Methanoculleus chikugoensis TaxID=118126 RepID=A0A1M4MKE5_9EURY|nr:hypothetical protein L21_1284 [Methanoculleus chikugoensis]
MRYSKPHSIQPHSAFEMMGLSYQSKPYSRISEILGMTPTKASWGLNKAILQKLLLRNCDPGLMCLLNTRLNLISYLLNVLIKFYC